MSSSDSDNDPNSNECTKLQKQLKEANHQLKRTKVVVEERVEEEGHGAVNQGQGTM
jgi:hypothetical protein